MGAALAVCAAATAWLLRLAIDSIAARTYGGTSEIHRNVIGKTLGL